MSSKLIVILILVSIVAIQVEADFIDDIDDIDDIVNIIEYTCFNDDMCISNAFNNYCCTLQCCNVFEFIFKDR